MSVRVYIYNVRACIIHTLYLVALLICLTACSGSGSDVSEPVTEPTSEGKAISFASGLQDEQTITRAEGLETEKTSFSVWGYKNDVYDATTGYTSFQTVFPGFTVNYVANAGKTTSSNTSGWDYVGQVADQTIKYWDWGAKAYRFFGVAPAGSYSPTVSEDKVTVTFTADASDDTKIGDTPFYSHLWFSTGNVNDYPTRKFGQPVLLEFTKPFAMVTVKFVDDSGYEYIEESIKTFSFKPTDSSKKVVVKGSITVSYPLKGTSTQETLTVNSVSGNLDNGITGAFKNLCSQSVLPSTGQGTYTMTLQLVTDAENQNHTTTVPAEYVNWKAGYVYTYVFKISSSNEVVLQAVQVGIRDWGVGNEVNHDIYNW